MACLEEVALPTCWAADPLRESIPASEWQVTWAIIATSAIVWKLLLLNVFSPGDKYLLCQRDQCPEMQATPSVGFRALGVEGSGASGFRVRFMVSPDTLKLRSLR